MTMEPRLPPGFREVAPNVYEGPLGKLGPGHYRGRVRVTTGLVAREDESHSCDAMGCRWDHVVAREVVNKDEAWPDLFLEEPHDPR